MIELLQDNLTTILGGSAIGAVGGGLIGFILSRIAGHGKMNEAMVSEARTLMGALNRFHEGSTSTQSSFTTIASLLSGQAVQTDPETGENNQPPEADGQAEAGALADKLLAAVLAIPALPAFPNIARDFDLLREHENFDAIFSQLTKLDTESINTMVGEFKTLVESTIQPGLEKAREGGFEFALEPQTLETLSLSITEFDKTIGGINNKIASIIGTLKSLVDDYYD